MNPKILVVLLFALGSVGCQSIHTSVEKVSTIKQEMSESQEQRWQFMVGRWYGSQPAKSGGTRQQIMERFPDGTYKITVRHVKKSGDSETNSEVGQWGIVGPVYFSIFRGWVKNYGIEPSDTSDPYNYDAYEIIELTNTDFKYKSYSSGTIFTLKKVGSDFEFPKL